jgi:hypothetical protein
MRRSLLLKAAAALLTVGLPTVLRAHPGDDAPRPDSEGYRIINLMPTFWKFWEKAEKRSRADKIRLFREMLVTPNAAVFEDAVPSAANDEQLGNYLENLGALIPGMRTLSERLGRELPAYRATFQQAFPDMAWKGDVYFLPSGMHFDGAVREISGKATLLFGLDMIAHLQGEKGNLAPLFHHELFHLYHRTVNPDCFRQPTLLMPLWTEGLATLVSQRLNPGATQGELLLPASLVDRCNATLPRLATELRQKLGSDQRQDFLDFFDGSSKRNDVPARAGYYLGLLLVRDVGSRMPLTDMARLSGDALRREVEIALRHLDTSALFPAECKADIAFAFAALEDVHPNPYARVKKTALTKERAKLEASLTGPMTREQFYRCLAPVIARLRDGSTRIDFPMQSWQTYRTGSGLIFPLDVVVQENRIFVEANCSENADLAAGTEIRSINGRPATKILEDLLDMESADLMPARWKGVRERFAPHLWLVYGMTGPFLVEYVPKSGGSVRMTALPGVPAALLDAKRNPRREPYAYRTLPVGIGLLEYHNCADAERFETFLKSSFAQIQKDRVRALVIDVRKNEGGDSRLNELFCGYFTEKPYRIFGKGETRICDRIKRIQGRDRYVSQFGVSAWGMLNGTLLTEEGRYVRAKPNPLRFSGPVYVLIGPGTLSSGTAFASAVKDCQLGTLIGEETGGPGSAYGDPVSLILPNSGLSLTVPMKRLYRPSGVDDGRGILPDRQVRQKREDTATGRDTVLEYTRALMTRETALEDGGTEEAVTPAAPTIAPITVRCSAFRA